MRALTLPKLAVSAKAELISNNLPEFEKAFEENIEKLKYELITDDDFIQAKADIKSLKDAEDQLKAVDEEIVNGSADLKTVRESLSSMADKMRSIRLARSKEVKEEDAKKQLAIVEAALALIDHPQRETFRSMVEGGTKSKKTLKSKTDGANLVADSIAKSILASRAVLDEFADAHGPLLIPDRSNLELEPASNVQDKLAARLEKKADEDEKERLKDEAEAARKEAEAAKAAQAEAEKTPSPVGRTQLDAHEEKESPSADVESGASSRATSSGGGSTPPPKIDSIPVGDTAKQEGETVTEEELRFISEFEAALMPIKKSRAGLKHPANRTKAAKLAEEIGKAWVEFKNPTSN